MVNRVGGGTWLSAEQYRPPVWRNVWLLIGVSSVYNPDRIEELGLAIGCRNGSMYDRSEYSFGKVMDKRWDRPLELGDGAKLTVLGWLPIAPPMLPNWEFSSLGYKVILNGDPIRIHEE